MRNGRCVGNRFIDFCGTGCNASFKYERPSSTMRCSGFGKSHSVGVIVENSLIRLPELGSLPSQLSVTVFHLSAAQGGMHLPSESAFVRDSVLAGEEWKVPVYVLASPSKLVKIRESYEKMGAAVVPFYLSTQDLNCARMLSLMCRITPPPCCVTHRF